MVADRSTRRSVTPDELAFATMFGIPAHLASILASLYRGEIVKPERWQISELRKQMESEAIDTTPNGYHLTEIGLADCDKAVADFKAWAMNGRTTA